MPATPPEFAYDVFISYSHRDKAWVRGELLPRLESAGLKVCVDYRDFRIGAPIVKEMERAVLTSRRTLLVLTATYLTSAWAEFENLMLQTLDPNNQQFRLIPLITEQVELPLRIRGLNYVDLTQADDLAFLWQRLLDALAAPANSGGQPAVAQTAQNTSPHVSRPTLPAPGQSTPAAEFNTAAVRELLAAAFSDEELTTFCADYYPPVYDNFAAGMSRTQKIQLLMDHCARRGQMAAMLARVEQANAYQYGQFKDRLRNK